MKLVKIILVFTLILLLSGCDTTKLTNGMYLWYKETGQIIEEEIDNRTFKFDGVGTLKQYMIAETHDEHIFNIYCEYEVCWFDMCDNITKDVFVEYFETIFIKE